MNAPDKKRLTGRIAAENIKLMAVPRPPQGAVERFLALGDVVAITGRRTSRRRDLSINHSRLIED